MAEKTQTLGRCFLSLPASPEFRLVRQAVEKAARRAGYVSVSLNDDLWRPTTIDESLLAELGRADLVVADVTGRNPNVFFELGLAQAMGKGIFLIANANSLEPSHTDWSGHQYFSYVLTRTGLNDLSKNLALALREHRDFPFVARSLLAPRLPTFLSIDWDRLDPVDAENLCLELLAQLGYQRVDWDKRAREFDLVAELPKRDPDGYEYRELWLVTMGRKAPIEMFMELVAHDPEYLIHRVLRDDTRVEQFLSNAGGASVTLLIVSLKESIPTEQLDMLRSKSARGYAMGRYTASFRLRIWDRAYLTTLVQQFPQLAYKYFSDEDRSRLKYRKTPEELYRENVRLLNRQSALLTQLEEEKNKRVRAERDSVWKDISFSAAHKIGNPIFAIETYLDPLQKRITEKRTGEATGIVTNIRATVEKAKGIVDQFKSLARAQEINPVAMKLSPVLEDACRAACNQEIDCKVECREDLVLVADPERLADCFDELVSNATHWFGMSDRTISIRVAEAALSSPPQELDSSKQYVTIHVQDNGAGVPVENKTRIFDAFFTTRDHGTGLGLAVVRRIVEGHGGHIEEVGKPGSGADFVMYLPKASVEEPGK